jgi:hypothetical protein
MPFAFAAFAVTIEPMPTLSAFIEALYSEKSLATATPMHSWRRMAIVVLHSELSPHSFSPFKDTKISSISEEI